jgi:hypothetical protein
MKEKTKGDKNEIKKRKNNKTLSEKVNKKQEKNFIKGNRRKKLKINILTHELLASTLFYLMLVLW